MNITIYIKDSTINMDEIATASIDLIITSPPYWNLIDYGHPQQLGINLSYKHYFYILKQNLLSCMRVLKEGAFACFIVGDIRSGKYTNNNRPCIYSLQYDLIKYFTDEMDFFLYQHFIWQKFGVKKGEKAGIIYGSVCKGEKKDYAVPPYLYNDLLMEHILVFMKPGKRELPDIRDRQNNQKNLIKKSVLQEWLNPVWHLNSPYNAQHKATFPGELAERLIRLYSLSGDTILDPFCGTGTALKKALEWDRNGIGYEINDRFLESLKEQYNLSIDGCKLFSTTN